VGQARTYIRGNDRVPGKIDIPDAIQSIRDGKVSVSLGLLPKILVNDKYSPGDLVPQAETITVSIQVLGPSWTKADRVSLFANGKKIRESEITEKSKPGIKWEGEWVLPPFGHDVYLVAITQGPYAYLPYWPLVKPYQPVSDKWTPTVMGSTGAVWIDGDGDGRRSSAYYYAMDSWKKSNGDTEKLVGLLGSYDEAVAIQAASILLKEGWDLGDLRLQKALTRGKPSTRAGFQRFIDELK
jgi:hypothetical protein